MLLHFHIWQRIGKICFRVSGQFPTNSYVSLYLYESMCLKEKPSPWKCKFRTQRGFSMQKFKSMIIFPENPAQMLIFLLNGKYDLNSHSTKAINNIIKKLARKR